MQRVSSAKSPYLESMAYYKAPPVNSVRPYNIPPRSQLVEIVTGGTVYFHWEGLDLTLGCGALFWHGPGDKTICLTTPEAPYECLVLRFVFPPGAPLRPRPPRLSVISDRHRTLELYAELFRSFHDAAVSRQALGHYAHARLLWEVHLGGHKPVLSYPASLAQAKALLEQQFFYAAFGVAQMAQGSGVSEAHLYALFRKHLGQSPHRVLIERRLQEAKFLLTSSTRAIKEISAACGFLNIETFYRAFRKITGVTPHYFRQTHSHPLMQRA